MSNTKKYAGIYIVNNTNDAIPAFMHTAICDAILAGGVLPEELADLLTLTRYEAADGSVRWILNYA